MIRIVYLNSNIFMYSYADIVGNNRDIDKK
jgi:hypothetical protein